MNISEFWNAKKETSLCVTSPGLWQVIYERPEKNPLTGQWDINYSTLGVEEIVFETPAQPKYRSLVGHYVGVTYTADQNEPHLWPSGVWTKLSDERNT